MVGLKCQVKLSLTSFCLVGMLFMNTGWRLGSAKSYELCKVTKAWRVSKVFRFV